MKNFLKELWRKILRHPGNFTVEPLRSINVRQFGAVGDGVTDDTSAIQRLLIIAPSFRQQQTFGQVQQALAAQQFPFLQRELPCPRCYQPMYHRASFDILSCNRCQLWVTRELAQVSYIEEWGHWADA